MSYYLMALKYSFSLLTLHIVDSTIFSVFSVFNYG